MEYVPKMVSLTDSRKEVRSDYQSQLDNWHSSGRPPQGLYSYKLEFGAEVLRESPPTIVKRVESMTGSGPAVEEDQEQGAVRRRRAFELTALQENKLTPVLHSESVTLSVANGDLASAEPDVAYRHGECDQLLFVHRADQPFTVLTDFGALEEVRQGDFVYLPRGTTYAFRDTGDVSMLAYASPERFYRPYDYWMGEQQPWPFPPEGKRPPMPTELDADEPIKTVLVKEQGGGGQTRIEYGAPVFDVVGWEGSVWPFAINLDEFNVLTSPNFHLDPPKVTAFVGETEEVYIQTFLPRWMQSPPYNHLNQVDEALFNHSGYEARPEIGDGFLTLHPVGIPHGPDPRVAKKIAEEGHPDDPQDLPWASEIGVMVESATAFSVSEAGESTEMADYNESWYEIAKEEGLI